MQGGGRGGRREDSQRVAMTHLDSSAVQFWRGNSLSSRFFIILIFFPQYYKHSRMRSFTRQLNQYSFWKGRSTGFEEGEVSAAVMYNHPNFRRGRPDLLARITRRPIGEAPPSQPVNGPIGRFNGVSHRCFGPGVDMSASVGMSKNEYENSGSTSIQRGTKRTRHSECARQEVKGVLASKSCASNLTGMDVEVASAEPVEVSKGKSSCLLAARSPECTSNDTFIARSSNPACWHDAAADTEWVALSKDRDGSHRAHDESNNDEDEISLNEDPAMAEMCKAITESDLAYV